ncbi:MAG: CHRD domain-containing protein [Cyclobacteriaceae bacterium]|nr:CHRD domain-containing protein [Cyclobacteriaceae bacterium]
MKKLIPLSVILISFLCFQACENQDVQPDVIPQAGTANPDAEDPGLAGTDANKRVINYVAHLSGDEEVPPVETNAVGQVKFQLSADGSELYYKLIVANINNVLASHIHLAPAGVSGLVVAFLFPGPLVPSANGILAEGTITSANLIGPLAGKTLADLVSAINDGQTYVNVHTIAFGGGEIRGQIK